MPSSDAAPSRRWRSRADPAQHLLLAHDLSAFVAHELIALSGALGGVDEAGGVAAGDEDEEVRGGAVGVDGEPADAGRRRRCWASVRGRSGATRRGATRKVWRTSGCRRHRRGRRRWTRSCGWRRCTGSGTRGGRGALPRALPGEAWRGAVVHVDEEPAAGGGAVAKGRRAGKAPERSGRQSPNARAVVLRSHWQVGHSRRAARPRTPSQRSFQLRNASLGRRAGGGFPARTGRFPFGAGRFPFGVD